MTTNLVRKTVIGLFTLFGMTVFALAVVQLSVSPPSGDLVVLALFLSISGGITVALAMGIAYFGLPKGFKSFRAHMITASGVMAVLALANVAFTAKLMFISTHDLALLGGLLVFSLGMSGFGVYIMSEPISRSVSEIIRVVKGVSAGKLDVNVPVHSDNEIGQLAVAINSMIRRLEISLTRERDLEEIRKELFRAVSHDLRTPVASIRAMIEAINDGIVTDDETVKRYMRTTQNEVENLSELINDLFELTQLDAGVMILHLDTASLRDLVSDTLEGMSVQASSRKVKLAGSVDETIPPLYLDVRRIQRVLYNLIQNSIRYTPADGTIVVTANNNSQEVQIEITDTGIGISEEDKPHIFDTSYRADHARARDSGGAGLGLAIAKAIVEAHGGRIWVESKEGAGSTFGFTLSKALIPAQRSDLAK